MAHCIRRGITHFRASRCLISTLGCPRPASESVQQLAVQETSVHCLECRGAADVWRGCRWPSGHFRLGPSRISGPTSDGTSSELRSRPGGFSWTGVAQSFIPGSVLIIIRLLGRVQHWIAASGRSPPRTPGSLMFEREHEDKHRLCNVERKSWPILAVSTAPAA